MLKKLIRINLKSKVQQIALGVLVLWIVLAYWLICEVLTKNALKTEANNLSVSASNLAINIAGDIDAQIKYLKEQPGLISLSPEIIGALNKASGTDLSFVSYEQRKKVLDNSEPYHQLSLYFDELEHKLNVNQIYLVDRWGLSVASSNWSLEGSSIGTNYKDRLNFSRGQAGLSTVQYSMGRTTHIPGLFFSTPIFQKKQFLGMLVVKVDLENLSQFRGSKNTFLVDGNQVVVATHDQRLNLKALSDVAIKHLSGPQINGLYLVDQIPVLDIRRWEKEESGLVKIMGEQVPIALASKSLDEYSMDVYVAQPFLDYFVVIDRYRYIFLAVSFIGLLLLLLLTLIYSYLLSIQKSNHELWYKGSHDAITGLPNQVFLLDNVKKLKASKSFKNFCLIYINFERFREINDRMGHEIGNALIKEAAKRIHALLPPNSLLSHLGGDRFCVFLCYEVDAKDAKNLCFMIQDSLQAPYRFNGSLALLKTTIVYHLFSSNQDFLNKVLLQSELLIKELRRSKGSRVTQYTEEFSELQSKRLLLKNGFSQAIESGQLIPHFQPIVNLQTGKIEKAELLIRWNHPEYGLLKPYEFISLAEQSESILKIGIWCRDQAIIYCKRWVDLLNIPFQMSVNKSPIELMDGDSETSIEYFMKQVYEKGLTGSNFAFEITESILVNDDFVSTQKINEIVKSGIKLSIDDFGTGFSSLSYLNRFPINSIKLDISFVANLTSGSNEEVVCGHIIEMAHQLGISVIAEGVETVDQKNILIALQCDYAQGYLYAPPLSAEDFESLLIENISLGS